VLPHRRSIFGWAALMLWAPTTWGAHCRFYLASQHSWGERRGFYLDLENSSEGEEPCKVGGLRLILGVADGKNWRFIVSGPPWDFEKIYKVLATISPEGAELRVDGKLVGESKGGFVPFLGELWANHIPGWASGPAEYIVLQNSLKLEGGGRRLDIEFEEARRPLPLLLFEPQAPRRLNWRVGEGETLSVEAVFELVRRPGIEGFAPYIDRYGQCRYADWPGKVRSDEDLKRAHEEELRRLRAWGAPKGYDGFGGFKLSGWGEEPTGFYRIVKRRGFYWLVTPEGNPCFYIGVCTAPALTWDMTPVTGREFLFEWLPPKEGLYRSAWGRDVWGAGDGAEYVALHTCNLLRKFGERWREEGMELTRLRLKVWGFSGIGKWGGMEGLPYIPVLSRAGVPCISRLPDVFDPEVKAAFRKRLAEQILPQRDNPYILGWSLGNEFDEIVTKSEVLAILGRPLPSPAKRAFVEFALESIYGGDLEKLARSWGSGSPNLDQLLRTELRPPPEDLTKIRRFYADRYYAFVYRTVKELDPNHLYLGFWIVPDWWEEEEDWSLIARHCDVLGYDRYALDFADQRLWRLFREAEKPVLCGEFSFPAWYGGMRGFGLYPVWAEDEAHSGELYQRWLYDAARNPYCVGVCWFQYRDQPLTGRGPGRGPRLVLGEHYAFGLVDVTDRPKWPLVERVREANLKAARWRLEAMGHP